MKNILTSILIFCCSISFAQDISGSWTGILTIQDSKLPLVFNFTQTTTGFTATMDSPNQGAKGIPIDEVTFTDKKITLSINVAGIKYTGEWKSDTEISGTFEQGTYTSPLVLTKGIIEIKKPQEPTKPYPYYTEDVQFQNTTENISLVGTLSLPQKGGTFPAVILITGSGQQNRDSELLGHKPFLVIADYLTRNGIAVLRYDDRGAGDSEGDFDSSTSANFANDARAAIEYLRTRKEINAKEIGIIGHSEGGMIAPMIAAKDKNIAFLVLLAGTGVAGDALLVDQNYQIGKLKGMTEEELEKAKVENQTIYNIIKLNNDISVSKKNLTTYFQSKVNEIPEDQRPPKEEIDAMLAQEVNSIATPWLHYFISYNPVQNLQKIKCPVLILNGEKDIQVSANLNTQGIVNALKEGGNKKFKVQIFPGLNHLFQHCTTCDAQEYSKLEETFAPEVLQTMSDWILSQAK